MYVCNGIGGRFDQTLANINTMFSVAVNVPLYLISEDSLVFVLEPVSVHAHISVYCKYYHVSCRGNILFMLI